MLSLNSSKFTANPSLNSKSAHEGKTSVQILPPVWKNNCTQVGFQWIFAGKWLLIKYGLLATLLALIQQYFTSTLNLIQIESATN